MNILLLPLLCMAAAVLCAGILAFFLVYNKPTFLIYFQIVYCCVMRFLISELHFPSVLRFLPDVVTLLLLVQCVLCIRNTRHIAIIKLPLGFAAVLAILVFFSFIANAQPILSLIWGVRVVFRSFVFWIACILFLREKDIFALIRILFIILAAHALAASFQYFVQRLVPDLVGGLFGIESGSNQEMNTFLVQLMICSMALYIYEKCSWKLLAFVLGTSIYIAALSELKVIFFEIPMIFLVLLVCSGWKRRSVALLLAGSAAVYFAILFLLIAYPDRADFFNLSAIVEYSGDMGYGGEGTLNRLSSISFVFETLYTSPLKWLIGYGLGNADSAAFYISDLARIYGSLRYHFFAFSLTLAEVGVLGTALYLGFFGAIFFCCLSFRRQDPQHRHWYTMAMIGSVLVPFHLIYSSSFRVDIIYNFMFWMAIPFILYRENLISQEDTRFNEHKKKGIMA